MKTSFLIWAAVTMFATGAYAGIEYSSRSGTVPDGSAVGWSATATASGYLPSISGVSVSLNISGGYNGDLYAYLSYGGALVPLLNRAGVQTGNAFGYSDQGFNITLSSLAENDVHFYANHSPVLVDGKLTQTWQPDGRNINPQSTPSAFSDFNPNNRVTFGSFNGSNPNTGTWTLFIADLSSGAQSQVVSWSLDITAVPEPVNVALGVFAGLFAVVGLARNKGLRKLLRQTPA
jgi:hypothetical protein